MRASNVRVPQRAAHVRLRQAAALWKETCPRGETAQATQYQPTSARAGYVTTPSRVGLYHIIWHHRLYDAIISTIRFPKHLSDARVISADELQKYQTDAVVVPYYNNVSEVVFVISISRQPHSFIFNFAVHSRPRASVRINRAAHMRLLASIITATDTSYPLLPL